MQTQFKIGIFDSGIGGLSIAKEVLKLLPSVTIYYIADDLFAPYGTKSGDLIRERCHTLTDMLLEKKIDLLLVACNTATAHGIESLRRGHPSLPIVGVEPFINYFSKYPETRNANTKACVITTELMGASQRFKDLKLRLDPDQHIQHITLKRLATVIDELFHRNLAIQDDSNLEAQILSECAPLKSSSYTHVILGCTHYPWIKNYLEDKFKFTCISPCPFVALRVRDLLPPLNPNATAIQELWFYETKQSTWKQTPLPLRELC